MRILRCCGFKFKTLALLTKQLLIVGSIYSFPYGRVLPMFRVKEMTNFKHTFWIALVLVVQL